MSPGGGKEEGGEWQKRGGGEGWKEQAGVTILNQNYISSFLKYSSDRVLELETVLYSHPHSHHLEQLLTLMIRLVWLDEAQSHAPLHRPSRSFKTLVRATPRTGSCSTLPEPHPAATSYSTRHLVPAIFFPSYNVTHHLQWFTIGIGRVANVQGADGGRMRDG